MFFVRYKDAVNGAYITMSLMPGPTDVSYPDARLYKPHSTQDGAIVVQRPLRDDRPRQWSWKGFRDSDLLAAYRNQWIILSKLEYRYRVRNNLPPVIEIWEDETSIGGFNGGTVGAKVWTKVKFLQVQRTIRGGGGYVVFDTSIIEMVIADDSYSAF
jgi:hypothetical protein